MRISFTQPSLLAVLFAFKLCMFVENRSTEVFLTDYNKSILIGIMRMIEHGKYFLRFCQVLKGAVGVCQSEAEVKFQMEIEHHFSSTEQADVGLGSRCWLKYERYIPASFWQRVTTTAPFKDWLLRYKSLTQSSFLSYILHLFYIHRYPFNFETSLKTYPKNILLFKVFYGVFGYLWCSPGSADIRGFRWRSMVGVDTPIIQGNHQVPLWKTIIHNSFWSWIRIIKLIKIQVWF